MGLRGLVKCSSIFFIIFLMCPKRTRLSAPLGDKQEYFHAVRRSVNDMSSISSSEWPIDVFEKKKGQTIVGRDDEPGFDLSDDEIRKFKLWPKGIIPYYIDAVSFNDKVLRDRIRLFLNTVNSLTRISFLELPSPPKDDNTRWVLFVNRRGLLDCADHSIKSFTNEGVQLVVLGYDCMSTGGELAEAVLSIAGVPPQHNSPDREEYVNIINENIMPDKKELFEKLNPDHWLFYDVKYDFSSAGHFHHHKYSVNGRATIESQTPYTRISMGESNDLTYSDIKKLRMLYNYIVKKKEDKVPECDKLFRRGRNFGKQGVTNINHSITKYKSRKKPNKYLGIAEEQHIEGNKENKGAGDNNAHKEEVRDEESDEDNHSEVARPSKLNLKSHPSINGNRETAKKFMDPLTYLSDYLTGEERGENRRVETRKNYKQ